MKSFSICFILFFSLFKAQAQSPSTDFTLQRPKLVVGIMVDQMRWDYLYRYYDSYGNDGFKRLLAKGYSCENTLIPYAQTVTAAGHASVYTGSTPAINGIVGNSWYDREKGREVYCAEDNEVKILGGTPSSNPRSPKNLWTTSICDELRLATNFKSKVIGVAIKDRGSILPSGHSANAAYWYDTNNGNWISSTFYMQQLPQWVNNFNSRHVVDSFYKLNWNTLNPINTYNQSTRDNAPYEGKNAHEKLPAFPHELASQIGKNYDQIRATPYGNTMTLMMAKQAMQHENLGNNGSTDFLNISLSSTDVIGHQTGINSIETEDVYRRLDKDLGDFFNYLDQKVGKGNYLFFITADHAASQTPGFLNENKMPGKAMDNHLEELNAAINKKFGIPEAFLGSYVYQLYLNHKSLDSAKIKKKSIMEFAINYLNKKDEVYLAYSTNELASVNLPSEIKEKFLKGYNPKLSGDLQVILKPNNFYGIQTGTQHGLWYPYDAHIPLIFYGWNIKPGQLNKEVYMTDIAPTLAALLHIQMPSGCIGKPIYEITQ